LRIVKTSTFNSAARNAFIELLLAEQENKHQLRHEVVPQRDNIGDDDRRSRWRPWRNLLPVPTPSIFAVS